MSRYSFAEILHFWDLEFKENRPDYPLAGSPERSLFRTVVEDSAERRFILEQLPPAVLVRKQETATTVEYLAHKGLEGLHPHLRNRDGDFITKALGGFWQISPFIDGVELPRPEYTLDAWRGKALARFLVDIKGRSAGIPFGDSRQPFSIVTFVRELMMRMNRHHPERAAAVEPAYLHLEKHFSSAHDRLPVAFCHGDPHPLNVIWGDDSIRAVIDWEFSGTKPEIYDAALLLGCIGMEDPGSLAGPLVMAFLNELRSANCFDAAGIAILPEFVLALRFAWLSDWLRKKDEEMVEMETDYIKLFLFHLRDLKEAWKS